MREDWNRLLKQCETSGCRWQMNTMKNRHSNRASQTGETKNLTAWSAGLRNGDSLGWKLKQHLTACHFKELEGLKCEKMPMKTFYHSPAVLSGSSWLWEKKTKTCSTARTESIQKIQQVRGPRWEWSTQMHAWANLRGRACLLKCLWLLFVIQQR